MLHKLEEDLLSWRKNGRTEVGGVDSPMLLCFCAASAFPVFYELVLLNDLSIKVTRYLAFF